MRLVLALAVLAIGFAALFPLARAAHRRLEVRGANRRLSLVLLVLVLALVPIGSGLATLSDHFREREFAALSQPLEAVTAAVGAGVLGPFEGDHAGELLLGLLRGREIPRQPTVEFRPLDLSVSGAERRSADGDLPFLLLDRRLRAGESLRFPTARHPTIERVAVAIPTGESDSLPTAELVVFGAGTARRTLTLDSSAERLHGWGEGADRTEVLALRLMPPFVGAAALEIRATDEPLRVAGACYGEGLLDAALVPEDRTRTGLPVRSVAGPSGTGTAILPGSPPTSFDIRPPLDCDRLWLIFSAVDPRAADYRWFGEDILDVRLEYDDGVAPEQHSLKHGEDLHSANLDRSRHADDFASSIAFTWDADGARMHADQRVWMLRGTRRLKRLVMKNVSGESGYSVNVLGVTAGRVTSEAPQPAHGGPLLLRDGRISLNRETLGSLSELRFAYADRRGVLRAAESGEGPRLIGASIETADLADVLAGKPCLPRCGSIAGADADLSILPVRADGSVVGALVAYRTEPDRAARHERFSFLPIAAGLLAAPFLLVTFAESLARGERIRRKIAAALAVAAMLPVGALLLTVPGAFARARSETDSQRLEAELRAIEERFDRQREGAAAQASAFLRELREHPRTAPLFAAPARADLESALRREMRALLERRFGRIAAFAKLELLLPGSPGSPWRAIEESTGALSAKRLDARASDFYRQGDRLVLVGTERSGGGEGRAQLVLGVAVGAPTDSVGGCRLFAPDGTPLDGAPLPEGVVPSALATCFETTLRTNRPTEIAGPVSGWADVFRARDGEPLFGIGVIEPPRAGDVSILGFRMSLAALLGGVAILGALSALAMSRILTDRITAPMERLARAAEETRRGTSPVIVEIESPDEVGFLAERFRSMSAELMRRIEHLGTLQEGMLGFAGRLHREEVATEASRFAAGSVSADRALLLLPDPQQQRWSAYASDGTVQRVRLSPLLRRCAAGDEWSLVSDEGPQPLSFLSAADRRWVSGHRAVLGGRVRFGGRDEGMLVLLFRAMPGEAQRSAARAAAGAIAIALENSRLYGLAIEDPETGALLPHAFTLRLQDAVERARSLRQTLWAVRLRIAEPANALAQLAGRILRLSGRRREAPLVGRTGPSELTVVLPSPGADAEKRLLRALRSPCTVVEARFPDQAQSAELLMDRLRGSAEMAHDVEGESGALAAGAPAASTEMRDTLGRAARIARAGLPTLLLGEPGVGKRGLAERIHAAWAPKEAPFVVLRISQIPAGLVDAELFGAERGAYSGADASRPGFFERAKGGTLFLQEIGEATPEVQAKLLRALQERVIRRIGGTREIPLELRILSSSSVDLMQRVQAGAFRADLYYRLAGVLLRVPALRERRADIPALAAEILGAATLTPRALDRLLSHNWPGNIPELEAVLRRASLQAGPDGVIDADAIEISRIRPSGEFTPSAAPVERRRPSRVGEAESRESWNIRQRQLLAVLRVGDRITTREYVGMMRVSSRTGLRDLLELVRQGRLRQDGRKRGTSFRFVE